MTKLRKQNNSATLNNTFQALLTRVQTALGQIIPDQSEVDSLRESIENQILVPSWFRFSTQLCYNWYPDGDGGQCGGMFLHSLTFMLSYTLPKKSPGNLDCYIDVKMLDLRALTGSYPAILLCDLIPMNRHAILHYIIPKQYIYCKISLWIRLDRQTFEWINFDRKAKLLVRGVGGLNEYCT